MEQRGQIGEHITHEAGNNDAWVCMCGNQPADDGFYTCDKSGNEVEPTTKDWNTNWYVCAACGRMIDYKTLEVVGRNQAPKLL
jgi:hypothetical protein